jgi:nitroimidazol reductase NimA-like FMN-containing flavoprotein (pyridoxamine 5'-phosphate oxidase superfamily)
MSPLAGPKALVPLAEPADAGKVRHGLIELDRRTSLGLLAGIDVGRVAWSEGERVMVFPLRRVKVRAMEDDSTEPKLLELSHDECFALLATRQVGRLGVVAEHYPLILPVNYALDHGVIVIRTGPGTKHANALHANITFEVDQIDEVSHAGWSVLVKGLAEEITPAHSAALIDRTMAVAPTPWAPGEHDHWMRLIPHYVSGRRLTPGGLADFFEAAAYL